MEILHGLSLTQRAEKFRPGTVYDHILKKIFKKRFLTKISNPYGNFKRYYPDFKIQFGLTQPGTIEISGKNQSIIYLLTYLLPLAPLGGA